MDGDRRYHHEVTGKPPHHPDAEAQRLVGAFLQSFALLERALDEGIGKVLGLQPGAVEAVCANIQFATKISVFFASENWLGEQPDPVRTKKLKATKSLTFALNDDRKIFAHCSFISKEGGGVIFRHVLARDRIDISNKSYDEADVYRICVQAEQTRANIAELAETMIPFVPKLDFSDPRNSQYIPLLFHTF